ESKQPLVVALDGPIDGRDADYLAIADVRDRRVAGRAQLTNGESTWTFTPSAPWRRGSYKLVVRGTLEDPAGNRLGSHFETSIHSPPESPVDAVVPFAVGGAGLPVRVPILREKETTMTSSIAARFDPRIWRLNITRAAGMWPGVLGPVL